MPPTDYKFTGQRAENFGLYDFNARYYDPLLGRFVSADSIVPGAGNPQALNRYSYVLNSPLKYVDPSGHCSDKAVQIIGGLFGTSPDCKGVETAQKFKALIVDIAGADNATVVGVGIANQSQYVSEFGIIDAVLDLLGKDPSMGIAQIRRSDSDCNKCDPNDPQQAITILSGRIKEAMGACDSCTAVDTLIAGALAQNAFSANTIGEIAKDPRYRTKGGSIDWVKYFKTRPNSGNGSIGLQLRMSSMKYKDWWLFQILIMSNDIQALQQLGWDLPPGITPADITYMQCLGQGQSDCQPPTDSSNP